MAAILVLGWFGKSSESNCVRKFMRPSENRYRLQCRRVARMKLIRRGLLSWKPAQLRDFHSDIVSLNDYRMNEGWCARREPDRLTYCGKFKIVMGLCSKKKSRRTGRSRCIEILSCEKLFM